MHFRVQNQILKYSLSITQLAKWENYGALLIFSQLIKKD